MDNQPKPWNAVCVLGLRVYSQDPEVSIKLIKPRNMEECAIFDVDGDTAAEATMWTGPTLRCKVVREVVLAKWGGLSIPVIPGVSPTFALTE